MPYSFSGHRKVSNIYTQYLWPNSAFVHAHASPIFFLDYENRLSAGNRGSVGMRALTLPRGQGCAVAGEHVGCGSNGQTMLLQIRAL